MMMMITAGVHVNTEYVLTKGRKGVLVVELGEGTRHGDGRTSRGGEKLHDCCYDHS